MKKRKKLRRSRQLEPRQHVPSATEAQERYAEQNEDIILAVEAMRRAQIVQEARTKNLLDSLTYRVVTPQAP